MTINYGLIGQERKPLIKAIEEITGRKAKYCMNGLMKYAYDFGDGLELHRDGTLKAVGNFDEILEQLCQRGFNAVNEQDKTEEAPAFEELQMTEREELGLEKERREDLQDENGIQPEPKADFKADKHNLPKLYTLDTPRGEIFIAEEFTTHDEANAEGYSEYFSTAAGTVYSYGDNHAFALVTSKKAEDWDKTTIKQDFRADSKINNLTVEMPMTGFTPEKLDNLAKLVNAKASLLKIALATDDLPIQQDDDTLQFPWFWSEQILTAEEVTAYTTLISLLCKTAKEKKRVTAKEKEAPDNPKYAMRCFLLSLGFIGNEYKTSRKILLSRLDGNSSWKNGNKSGGN